MENSIWKQRLCLQLHLKRWMLCIVQTTKGRPWVSYLRGNSKSGINSNAWKFLEEVIPRLLPVSPLQCLFSSLSCSLSLSTSFSCIFVCMCDSYSCLQKCDNKDLSFFIFGFLSRSIHACSPQLVPPVCLACVYLFLCSPGINYHNHMPG